MNYKKCKEIALRIYSRAETHENGLLLLEVNISTSIKGGERERAFRKVKSQMKKEQNKLKTRLVKIFHK